MQYYDRYQTFLVEGQQTTVPFVRIPKRTSDQSYIYKVNKSRLDKISFEKYGSPAFGWLIMAANPKYGGLEWNIGDSDVITIPFPLTQALQDYKSALDTHFFYYVR